MIRIAILFLFIVGMTQAQNIDNTVDCESLKDEGLEFLLDGSLSSEAVLVEKLAPLKSCGLDDYDIQFFGQMDKMSAILKRLTAIKSINSLTYADLLEQIESGIKSDSYQRIKQTTLKSEDLGNRVGTYATWENDQLIFIDLGASQRIIDNVGDYLKTHPENKKSYREILESLNPKE